MKPITYSKEFFKMKFTGCTMKEAYMNACKWFATNVLSKNDLHDVQVEYVKNNDETPSVTMHLFATLDEIKLRERHCAICKETNSLFYMKNCNNCNKCEANAYQRRTDDMLRVKIDFYREQIAKCTKEGYIRDEDD